MNERYAVDPEAPANSRELKLLLDLMGLQTGRFITAFPNDWRDMVLQHVGGESAIERARVVELLSRRSDSYLPSRGEYRRSTGWKDNAQSRLKIGRDCAATISDKAAAPGWLELESVLYEHAGCLPEGVGAHVAGTAEAYARCVEPVFAFSPEVYLLDPYFTLATRSGSLDRRRAPVLRSFIRLAEQSTTCQRLVLILSEDRILDTHRTEASLEDALEEALAEANSNRVELVYKVVAHPPHGRYLFGMRGGLQFDQGFEQLPADKTNHIHWLSGPELKPLLSLVGPVDRR